MRLWASGRYAEYEQLVGGVDTLFKNASGKVQQYAANAFQTAGMSGNEYMNLVTSFSASLINSLGGDTNLAADVANQAITDMADNANKMGTDLGTIQNAYGRALFNVVEDERFPLPVIIPVCITGEEISEVTPENFGKEVKLYLYERKVG